MPPMKCCRKTLSVGSDDFVVTSLIGIIIHTIWFVWVTAFALIVLVGQDCFPDGTREDVVFAFIFSQIATHMLVIISEVLVAFVSSRGTINNDKPRRFLPHFLCIRALLYALEILSIVFGGYIAWSPYIQDHIHCEHSDRVSETIEAYEISLIVVHVIIAVLFMIYFDPLGLKTPSLLKELNLVKDDDDDDIVFELVHHKRRGDKVYKDVKRKRMYRASSWARWTQRVRVLCYCAGANTRTKGQALKDIAHAMATMFDGIENKMVPTDFVAALMLVHRHQKEHDLGAQLKRITCKHMNKSEENQFTPEYEENVSECKIDASVPDIKSLLGDVRHYLKFALGIYGWPIHVYMNPLVGSLCLCANMKCRAFNSSRAEDFVHDNCCLANTTAFQLRSKLSNDHVICTSYKNEVHLPPYSLSYDHPRKAVVLSIRGSMSLRDALTDMNISMKPIPVKDEICKGRTTKVHSGIYHAAINIRREIDEKLQRELHDSGYKLIITGHSLGAGVGAVLAVLYREEFHNLHCYAFSPPGSLFTLPLVEYSKSFITTIIYGNDIVPRLTFRGLLHLKLNMTYLIECCSLPKHAVLCPSMFSCCYEQVSYRELEDEVFDDPTDQKPKGVTSLHRLAENVHTIDDMRTPAFVPGKVLYIRETGRRKRQRFWNIIGEKELYAVWMPNADFCHIIVDKGILDDHMPDSVHEAVENLYKQLFGTEAHNMTRDTKSDKTEPSVQNRNSNTQPNGVGEVSNPECEPDDTEVTEGIINNSDVNEDTIEITVHSTREDNNNASLIVGQEESTHV